VTTFRTRPDRPELDPNNPGDALILRGLRVTCVPTHMAGVLAHVDRSADGTFIVRGVITAEPRIPGAVGRWLDWLPRDRTVLVPAVVSGRLAGMLERRGFRPHLWLDPEVGTYDNGAYRREAR
jgi:hypothetical protein